MNVASTNGKTINNSKYSFTKDQEVAINGIIDFIADPFNLNKYIVGLTGPGGTGKTFVTNYIIKHCKYAPSVIKCTSPTHKACRVFSMSIGNKEVNTIQSTFGFRLDMRLEDFDPINPRFSPISKPKLENIKLLLIDEASMLPSKLVVYINNICKKLNIKIIYIGDDYQLSPVNEKRSTAFSSCVKLYRLEEIVRQTANNPIIKLLDIIREDIKYKSFEFLNYVIKHKGKIDYNEESKGYAICNPSQFNQLINSSFKDENYTKNIDMYRIIAYTNLCVSSWNNYIRNLIIEDANKNIITKNDLIMSYETIVDDFNSPIITNSEEYIINDITNFVDTDYQFKGFLIKFQLVNGGDITKPLFVIDSKDKFTVQRYYQIIQELINAAKLANGGQRASKWKEYYTFKKKYLIASNIINRTGTILHSRDLDYGFAITAHKSQGSTYDTVFIDLNDMVFNKNGIIYPDKEDLLRRIYVACSRARSNLIICYGN